MLHVVTRVGRISLVDRVIDGKVEIPELDVVLDRRSTGGQGDESTLGRPCEGVGSLVFELTCMSGTSVQPSTSNRENDIAQDTHASS